MAGTPGNVLIGAGTLYTAPANTPTPATAVITQAITAIAAATGNVTYTVAANTFTVGQSVTITGATIPGYNGTFTITAVTGTTFVVVNAATGATSTASATVGSILSTTGICIPTSPWTAVGFTEDGLTLMYDQKIQETRVEEQSTPVLVTKDTSDFKVTATLAEDTIANMQLAYGNGTITTTAGTAGVAGTTTLALSDTLLNLAICVVSTNAAGLSRVLYIPSVIAAGKVSTKYRRAAGPRTYSLELTATCPVASIVTTDVTATHA